MLTVTPSYGMFAASWHDGTKWIDPDPLRAASLALEDAARPEARVFAARRVFTGPASAVLAARYRRFRERRGSRVDVFA